MGFIIFILAIFILQIIVIGTIIFVLKRRLDRQLIELAIQKFERLNAEDIGPEEKDLVVITAKKIEEGVRHRLIEVSFKKVHRALNLIAQEDRSTKGGIIIKMKNFSIDYSLAGRLRESGLMGKIFHG